MRYYAEECDEEFEIERPGNCGLLYSFLIRYKVRSGIALLAEDLAGRSILEVCCGSGMVGEMLAQEGGCVTGIDCSLAAIRRARERARRKRFRASFFVADAQALPFCGASFDIVVVHDGLHHLGDPFAALAEMGRVAKRGLVILEPAKAALTQLAVRMGLAANVEEAGNYVHRLSPREVAFFLQERGFSYVEWRRTLMYYPHVPFRWFRYFDRRSLFVLFRLVFWAANLLLGRWGNKLALVALRQSAPVGREHGFDAYASAGYRD